MLYGVVAGHLERFLARQREGDRNVPEYEASSDQTAAPPNPRLPPFSASDGVNEFRFSSGIAVAFGGLYLDK